MKKPGFWVGNLEDAAIVSQGVPYLRNAQSESEQFKQDGLVLLIEGEGRNAERKVVFDALATVNYDEATSTYRFQAHSDGRFLDTELKVEKNAFSWGYTSGPLKVMNSMVVSDKGEWVETTESIFNSSPPRRSVEMKLPKLP